MESAPVSARQTQEERRQELHRKAWDVAKRAVELL